MYHPRILRQVAPGPRSISRPSPTTFSSMTFKDEFPSLSLATMTPSVPAKESVTYIKHEHYTNEKSVWSVRGNGTSKEDFENYLGDHLEKWKAGGLVTTVRNRKKIHFREKNRDGQKRWEYVVYVEIQGYVNLGPILI